MADPKTINGGITLKKTTKLTLVLVLLAIPGILLAEDLPSGEKIIEKFNEASGGLDAWQGHETMQIVGDFSMPAMGISAKIEVWKQAPNLDYTKIVSDAFGTMEEGCNGTVAWEKSMMTGVKVKDGSELAMALRGAQFNPWAVWKDFYQSATTTGREAVDGVDCYVVKMVPNENEGEPELNYFAVESGLLVKTSVVLINEMGNINIDAFISDYREVDGIMAPFKVRQVLMGMQEIVMTFEQQSFDVEIPAGAFDLPEDVKALLEAK
jgi:Protein of unknown function (DUF620)